ncbi:MAG: LacI family transcriptional regulator [Caldibacillus debilis]|uniref:LacI family transcriptional regulator n=1 Tax=Caldibacillus debilis TaxID=301148 RepID=A0A3E0K465_9BACI|nr:LacI family DNA-binding transcriptional regulator [Caldibacillus debilis]REJ25191.1 MAG: LacI family transcriptional regulator [Caldibacillus debilis]REJ28510.1 MAG: LacI family transcriptional regulator [Caldibacillus debilis]
MKPTIYDVAKKAGVSITTVSKVINNTGSISEKTRKKVLKVMEEMDYYPSGIAAALTVKKTYTIGALLPDISNPFFAEMAKSLENSAREHGYSIIFCSTDYLIEREKEYLDLLFKKQIDGLIIAIEPTDSDMIQKLQKKHLPHLLLSVDNPVLRTSIVSTDDRLGGYLAGNYLLEKGHREVSVIYEDNRSSSRYRLKGFMEAFENANLNVNKNLIIPSKSKMEEAREAARIILKREKKPTALFATTDLIATVFINEARKLNIAVPDGISVIGYDNTIYAELCEPGLTTIAQPVTDLATYAIRMLLETMEKPDLPKAKILLTPKLLERESVKDIN